MVAVRETRSSWLWSEYLGKLEVSTSLEAELWGLFRGLELVHDKGLETMEVESDSEVAVSMINGVCPEHSPHKVLIQECTALMKATGCSLKHIYREGNQIADRLANMGVDQEERMVSHVIPRDEIIPFSEADMRGVSFERE